MNETTILQRIRLAIGRIKSVKLFRNNCGQAWMGKVIRKTADTVTIQNPRPVQFGLHPGSADLIGWKSIVITPEMVGRKVAVFVSIECKTPDGKVRPDQEQWQLVIQEAGGIACIARGEDAALQCLTKKD